ATYSLAGIKSFDKANTTYSVDLKKEPFSLTSATANFGGAATVSFDGYGTPSSGGTVVLAAKSHQCTVTLNGTTGDVTISSNHSGGRAAAFRGRERSRPPMSHRITVNRRPRGFTMLEMIVAMVASAVLLAGL